MRTDISFPELSLVAHELEEVLVAAETADGEPMKVFRLLNAGTRLAGILARSIDHLEMGEVREAAYLLGYKPQEEARE